jgi:hypothetical protein
VNVVKVFTGGIHSTYQVMMGDANKTYSRNYELTSLSMQHGIALPEFEVSHWLSDGESIFIDPDDVDSRLEVKYFKEKMILYRARQHIDSP